MPCENQSERNLLSGGFVSVKGLLLLALFELLFIPLVCSPCHCTDLILNNTPAKVLFSPDGECTEAIITEIQNAKSEILVQAYSFTSAPIAKALLEAHKRGVKVQAIMDKSQRTANYSSATFLANSRIPTFIDDAHAIAHNKVMIIDGLTVITGSFNFTKAAEQKNAENLLIIQSKDLAKIYEDNWDRHREHSDEYASVLKKTTANKISFRCTQVD
jgi:phosphatidylserine/phosphatidylglycerophosphate/cardiolipin synthase-like enzyme